MDNPALRTTQANAVTLKGFWVNAALSVFKVVAGFLGHSGAMIADGLHSLSDFLTDGVVLLGIKLSSRPEDETHNYGHGKYETLATSIISLFLFAAGFMILRTGFLQIVETIKGDPPPVPGLIALVAAGVSIVVKEWLYWFTLREGKRLNSQSVVANAWHHRSDALSSIGVFVGIGGAILLGERWAVLDPIASILVSLLLFWVALKILLPALSELIETSLEKGQIESITASITGHPSVRAFHHLRTRKTGTRCIVEFHIKVDPSMNITTAHEVATQIEDNIKEELGETSIVTIHIEPFGVCTRRRYKQTVKTNDRHVS